jgi:hypothetical protein
MPGNEAILLVSLGCGVVVPRIVMEQPAAAPFAR